MNPNGTGFVVAVLFLCNLTVSSLESFAADKPYTREQIDSKLNVLETNQEKDHERIQRELEKKIDLVKESINNSQKLIDWWIGFLTIFVALVAIIVPFAISRVFRNQYRKAAEDAERAARDAEIAVVEIQGYAQKARSDSDSIAKRRAILESQEPDQPVSTEAERKAIKEALSDPSSPVRDRLRALALQYQEREKWDEATAIWLSLSHLLPDDPDPLVHYASAIGQLSQEKEKNEARPLLLKARDAISASLAISPNNYVALNIYGNILSALGKLDGEATEKKRLFEDAIAKYRQALAIKPDYSSALNNWGNALGELADLTDDATEKKRLFEDGSTKYQQALAIRPDNQRALYNWGKRLSELADLTDDATQKKRLFEDAIAKYQQALAIKPNYSSALNNWGNVLGKLAGQTDDATEKRRLLEDAIAKFQQALAIKRDQRYVLTNWGTALGELADLTDDATEKKRLFEDAIAKYRQALAIKPDYSSALNNWGNVLVKLADLTEDATEKRRLLEDAIAKYQQVLTIEPDHKFAVENLALTRRTLGGLT